ncbi:hypothetical protein [Mesobacillus foraminis]|uniref:hypothetical protein n=1 Tax=Mesobacillus foraminis TaxID=279826 RepID=UPI000EF49AB1|nr:hypothetical protein [Mesobacillus foraminis]
MDGHSENYHHRLNFVKKRSKKNLRYFLWEGWSKEFNDQEYYLLWQVQTTISGAKISAECLKVKIDHNHTRNPYHEPTFIKMPAEIYNEFIVKVYEKHRAIIRLMKLS